MNKINPKTECAVRIAVRERPRMSTDAFDASPEKLDSDFIQRAGALTDNILVVGDRPFAFDAVLGPTVDQATLYAELIEPMVGKLLSGFFCTVLAYGQTGTGKSFTMGLHAEAFENEKGGIVPRVLVDIFDRTSAMSEDTESEIFVSFIEIYNERVFDLLCDQSDDPVNTKGVKFVGGAKKLVHCLADAQRVLDEGNRNRHVRPTKMNAQSSRSHAIFTIHTMVRQNNRRTESSMHLVDLAGSEGVRRTGHQGVALVEGVHINQGLLSIGKVLQALSVGAKVIPYRDSVLSSVLQDSLNLNAYLTLLACISPLKDDASETLSTLRFAQNAKSLRHTPQINAIITEIKKTRTPSKLKTPSKHLTNAAAVSPLRNRNKTPTTRKPPLASSTAFKRRPAPPVFRSNTFCTPNKNLPGNMSNLTIVGATEKNKRPVQSLGFGPRESLFVPDQSQMFLDVSTSTVVEQSTVQSTNYSPIVRRCVQEVGLNMGAQLRQMLDSMQADGTLAQQTMICNSENGERPPSTEKQTQKGDLMDTIEVIADNQKIETKQETPKTKHGVGNISWNTLRKELTQIVRTEVLNAQQFSIMGQCTSIPQATPNPQPNCNDSKSLQCEDNSLIEDLTVISSTIAELPLPTDPFKIPDNPISIKHKPAVRRSTRRATSHLTDASICLGDIEHNQTRRSARISIRRDSTRESPKPIDIVKPSRKYNQTGRAKKTDEILAKMISAQSKSQAKNVQNEIVLKLFNTATMKDLQILPEIGVKMAYKIIAYRTSNKKLKSIDDISKMPIWRGKGWERFKTLNFLK